MRNHNSEQGPCITHILGERAMCDVFMWYMILHHVDSINSSKSRSLNRGLELRGNFRFSKGFIKMESSPIQVLQMS